MTWYHGSPKKLKRLRKGSTITQNYEIARIFSHKPAVVVGNDKEWKHTGPFVKGFVYSLLGAVNQEDLEKVLNSTMSEGDEWNTKVEFKVKLVSEIKLNPSELLTKRELLELANQGKIDKRTVETILKKQNLPD